MTLLHRLTEVYPDWRRYHKTPIEAAVEVGLLDEADLAASEVPELDFDDPDWPPPVEVYEDDPDAY